MFTHASYRQKTDVNHLQEKVNLVERLGLTDLCLFTEASYTRHLSLADFHTAFQDSPMALEHFPSGSLVTHPQPPRRCMRTWIERHRNILDFTLSSLLRRKRKNAALVSVYTLIVFLLASVLLFTYALREEASILLKEAPEMIVQKLVAGRQELDPGGLHGADQGHPGGELDQGASVGVLL